MIGAFATDLSPPPPHRPMRRLPTLLWLLAVWLHAVVMLPMHSHASADTGEASSELAEQHGHDLGKASGNNTAPDDRPDLDGGCVWCAWAHLAFALLPSVSMPPISSAHQAHFASAPIWVRTGTPVSAFQARGPPEKGAA